MKIYLNIYDLAKANYYLHSIGFGLYHTGIQIGSQEYHFGGHDGTSTGVCVTAPKEFSSNVIYRETIYLGDCALPASQVNQIIEELKREFPGNSYDVLKHNCNHFTNTVSKRLLSISIPSYINRAASLGNIMRCCLPTSIMEGPQSDPTRPQSAAASASAQKQQRPQQTQKYNGTANQHASKSGQSSSVNSFAAFKGTGVSLGGQSKSTIGTTKTPIQQKKGYIKQENELEM